MVDQRVRKLSSGETNNAMDIEGKLWYGKSGGGTG